MCNSSDFCAAFFPAARAVPPCGGATEARCTRRAVHRICIWFEGGDGDGDETRSLTSCVPSLRLATSVKKRKEKKRKERVSLRARENKQHTRLIKICFSLLEQTTCPKSTVPEKEAWRFLAHKPCMRNWKRTNYTDIASPRTRSCTPRCRGVQVHERAHYVDDLACRSGTAFCPRPVRLS